MALGRCRGTPASMPRRAASAPAVDQRNDTIGQAPCRPHDEERGGRRDRPGDDVRFHPLDQKVRSQAEVEERDVTMHTITLDISNANMSRGLASMIIPSHQGGGWGERMRNPSIFAQFLTIA